MTAAKNLSPYEQPEEPTGEEKMEAFYVEKLEQLREMNGLLVQELKRALGETMHSADCGHESFGRSGCTCWREKAKKALEKARGQ